MSTRKQRVKIGEREIDEVALSAELIRVQNEIELWGKQNQLWHDEGFATPFLYHDEPPQSHETLLLLSEGCISRIFALDGAYNEYESSFTEMLERLGYEFEMENHYTFVLYPIDEPLRDDFLCLHRWQWLQKLAKQKHIELHSEVFDYFAKRPEDLKRIEWRQFEELLNAIFRNQGFYTELGTGRNDGGVDIRLYQSRAIPELVTLVQAKRFKNPIKQEAVAALWANAVVQGAEHSIFATTSYFQPRVKEFAKSVEQMVALPKLELADASRIAGWCAEIGRNLSNYFTNGLTTPPMVTEKVGPLAGRIVVAHGGYNCTMNYFAEIEADFPQEVILRPLGQEMVSGDGQTGYVVPKDTNDSGSIQAERLLGTKKDGGYFWADLELYSLWDGNPQHFNSD
jgi:restriction system protein